MEKAKFIIKSSIVIYMENTNFFKSFLKIFHTKINKNRSENIKNDIFIGNSTSSIQPCQKIDKKKCLWKIRLAGTLQVRSKFYRIT